jgi:uncharacterized protein YidB (DUF937 family)
MSLLDMAGSLLGGQHQQGGLMEAVLGLVNEHGGLQGLISKLQASGLGEQAKSWVGTGDNLPVSPEQIQSFLGGTKLQALAAQFGLGHQETASGLAELLPQAVDKLTPNGEIPTEGQDPMSMLKNLLG